MEDCMERLYFEIPGIARKEDAIDYIREFREYQSEINGTGGLDRFTDNYEEWLEKLEQDYTRIPNEEKVPARTFFLVRDTDRATTTRATFWSSPTTNPGRDLQRRWGPSTTPSISATCTS